MAKNSPTQSMHIKEDYTKPENRTNLALLSILQVDEIRELVLDALALPRDSLLYPCPNLETEEFVSSQRPDFVARSPSGTTLAYIEVELGPQNDAQIDGYRSLVSTPVYSLVGKRTYKPQDLSLEDIYDQARRVQHAYQGMQQYVSLQLFCSLVRYYVVDGNFRSANTRSNLSEQMLSSKLVQMIYAHFGAETILQAGAGVMPGKIRLDTVGEGGLSLRVCSTITGRDGFSLLNRTGGRRFIEFPSLAQLRRYFPSRLEACEHYAELIAQLGNPDILSLPERKRARLALETVERRFEDIAKVIRELM